MKPMLMMMRRVNDMNDDDVNNVCDIKMRGDIE